MNLAPCPFRHVDDEGHILCDKIKTGDREVSPNICRACPISAINCGHLRATLDHQTRPPITVRYGNGKTEIWEDEAPSLILQRAACAAKVVPILSPRDCAGCALRQALNSPNTIAVPNDIPAPAPAAPAPLRKTAARPRVAAPPPIPAPAPAPMPAAPMAAQVSNTVAKLDPVQSEEEKKRSSIVAEKIIKLQEWLEKQKNAPQPLHREDELPPVEQERLPRVMAARPARPARAEEKRVGWTD